VKDAKSAQRGFREGFYVRNGASIDFCSNETYYDKAEIRKRSGGALEFVIYMDPARVQE
jgi:hypothetical protein